MNIKQKANETFDAPNMKQKNVGKTVQINEHGTLQVLKFKILLLMRSMKSDDEFSEYNGVVLSPPPVPRYPCKTKFWISQYEIVDYGIYACIAGFSR